MFRHLILATTIAVALSGCTQMAAGSRPHTDTGTPDISTFLHPENARPDGMSDIRYQLLNETGKHWDSGEDVQSAPPSCAGHLNTAPQHLMPCTTSGRCSARKAGCHR